MPHPPASVVVRPASWQDDRAALERVRRSVFIEEQGIPEAEEWDATDPVARHVLAIADGHAVAGTGRLEPSGKIGRIAVLTGYRGRGIGATIVTHLVNQATELGFARVYLHAQTAAAAFYARLGFRATGPEFGEAGIPHVRMDLGIERDDGNLAGRHGHEEHPLDAR